MCYVGKNSTSEIVGVAGASAGVPLEGPEGGAGGVLGTSECTQSSGTS